MKNFRICFIVCTVILILSCERDYRREPLPPDTIDICSGCQGEVGDVRIGSANYGRDEYEGANGKKEWGQTAQLWISVKNHPPINNNRAIKVGKGSKFSAGQFSFEVLDVTSDTIVIRYSPSP